MNDHMITTNGVRPASSPSCFRCQLCIVKGAQGWQGGILATNEALDIVDGPLRVERRLVLGCFTNEALLVCECHIGRCDAVAQIVCDDLNPAILVDAHT